MTVRQLLFFSLTFFIALSPLDPAFAKKRSHRRRSYPPVTHPVVLWSRTLSESTDAEQRKIAAFKLSQYTQPIYQDEVINTLIRAMKDSDVTIKVFSAKAMGRAGTQSKNDWIRKSLIEQYKADPQLRSTLIRTFIARKDNHPLVHETILETAKSSKDPEELLPALNYFELFGNSAFFDTAVSIYEKSDNAKIKRSAVKALAERGQGQDSIINILSQCTGSKDTPLALTCLAGLQVQGKKDSKTWSAVEKTITSSDPDVVMATLDVIHVLPESPNSVISKRLVEIISDGDDSELLERALLALGVCGDFSESGVKATQKILEKKEADDGLRVSAALVLGKQAAKFPEGAIAALSQCKNSANTQSLKTACQLGLQELESRKVVTASSKTPEAEPAKEVAPNTPTAPSKTAEPAKKEESPVEKSFTVPPPGAPKTFEGGLEISK